MRAHGAAIGNTCIIRATSRGQGNEVRGQVAAVLVLERIP